MISIIDYGVGNLRSVEKAFHFIGCEAKVTSDRTEVLAADGVVLPGVGAFADAMKNLKNLEMDCVVRDVIEMGRPFLGICLGMQLLFEYSEEGGEHVEGLGLFRGAIKQLPGDMNLKVPHMGWNSLKILKDCRLFNKLPASPYVYFVHSYYLKAEDPDIVVATASYGIEFDVAINSGNVFATQFHPEKSGEIGLAMLRNFADIVKGEL